MKTALTLLFAFLVFSQLNAQNNTLSKPETDSMITELSEVLNRTYFDKVKSEIIIETLQKKLKAGELYDVPNITSKLTIILRELTNDIHFFVGVNPPRDNERRPRQERSYNNGGFSEAKIIDINIGYIKWNDFTANDDSFQKIISALQFVEGCKYLIFDISKCPGGDGRIGGFVQSHLFRNNSYQNLLLKKCGGDDDWYQSEVPYNYTNGPKFYDIPVYVMVSEGTASAAEYFAWILQEMGRATILGKTTAGAGNPVTRVEFGDYFAFIPICQIITKDGRSIEAKGVIPDVELPTDSLLQETIKYIRENND